MKRIILVGCAGHATVVADIIHCQGIFKIVGFIDDEPSNSHLDKSIKWLGPITHIDAKIKHSKTNILALGIGENVTRKKITSRIKEEASTAYFLNIIHPSAVIASDVLLGHGNVIMAQAVINTGTILEDFCVVNTKASLDHDSKMESFSSLGPGVTTGGNVVVGKGSHIALGANIIQGVSIGENSVIGAGSTVIRDIPSHILAYGIPAKIIKTRKDSERTF